MMEGAGLRGRWDRKAPVGTILLPMCMFLTAVTLISEAKTCPAGDYDNDNGVCCNKCLPGFRLVEKCHSNNTRSICKQCGTGLYTDQENYARNCRSCRKCKASNHEVEISPCKAVRNTVCRCEDGYYKHNIDSEKYECLKCSSCKLNEIEKRTCTPENNTVCACEEKYYRVKGKTCEPCKTCTSECQHHCLPITTKTKAPDHRNDHLINIIVGVVVGSMVSMGLVFLVTYMVTKRSTKKKMQKKTSQELDPCPESGEQFLTLIESADIQSDRALPLSAVSDQEPPNLPDCVPLEVKIPELIYTVLDLVPVLQVKQLVRTLGVTDTEIEQAEADHRSCREAHYQMLRVWAEKGSRSGGGGGGRGTMLHWPLLQELLDQLRKMHLGWAAEELETKYDIQ
ncbi:tumor necrosis factor receptor superfamily member 1A [Notothenia coriiceps]|uniref:Tumor necrosis factor receptor superfamily member 1A n=1 Tax=Notothenia coriiceps TaxID=8208 RepID=A0A6I9N486_9TELE|nr:PREDICTED: tumor necrosis factor receptor superfamily member 1A [Notothenia coriiceps]